MKRSNLPVPKFALLLTLLLAILLFCAKPHHPLSFEKRMIANDYKGWWGRTLVDMNGDGLLDVALLKQALKPEGATGWLGWYETRQGGSEWTLHVIEKDNPVFGSGDLAAGDFDNDSDIDIIAFEVEKEGTDKPGDVFWYENPGDPSSADWPRHFIGKSPAFVKDVELADFNQDGKLDVVIVTYVYNKVVIFRQDSPTEWATVQEIFVNNLHEGMDIGDIDGDGDTDIAANGYWLENPGGDLSAEWPLRSIDEKWHNQSGDWRKNATKVFCKDINDDGRVEVFISHSESQEYKYPIAWYESDDPRNGSWTEHIIAENYRHCHTLQVFDMDLDGDADVLAGEIPEQPTDKRVRIFLNKGNFLEWEEYTFSDQGIYNGLVGDLEGDGDYDIFTAPGFSDQYPDYNVWVNQVIQ